MDLSMSAMTPTVPSVWLWTAWYHRVACRHDCKMHCKTPDMIKGVAGSIDRGVSAWAPTSGTTPSRSARLSSGS